MVHFRVCVYLLIIDCSSLPLVWGPYCMYFLFLLENDPSNESSVSVCKKCGDNLTSSNLYLIRFKKIYLEVPVLHKFGSQLVGTLVIAPLLYIYIYVCVVRSLVPKLFIVTELRSIYRVNCT